MLIGYAPVSKADGTQLLDPQRDVLIGAGVDEEIVVWKFHRLGRNLKHLVTTVEELHGPEVGKITLMFRSGSAISKQHLFKMLPTYLNRSEMISHCL